MCTIKRCHASSQESLIDGLSQKHGECLEIMGSHCNKMKLVIHVYDADLQYNRQNGKIALYILQCKSHVSEEDSSTSEASIMPGPRWSLLRKTVMNQSQRIVMD